MAIERHTCFSDGEIKLGSAPDCPKCWTALEQSVELAVSEGTFTGDGSSSAGNEISPEITPLPACHCSSCDPRTCAYCGHPRGKPGCTFCKTEIRKYMDAGRWSVWCSGCGWKVEGLCTPAETDTVSAMIDMMGRDHFEEHHRADEDGHS